MLAGQGLHSAQKRPQRPPKGPERRCSVAPVLTDAPGTAPGPPWLTHPSHRTRTLRCSPRAQPPSSASQRHTRPILAPGPTLLSPLMPPTAKATSSISGRHQQFKKRAAALSAPRIGCQSHRPSVNHHLIRHLSELSRPLPSFFGQSFSSFPLGLGAIPAAHGWEVSYWRWEVSWADYQALLQYSTAGCRTGEGCFMLIGCRGVSNASNGRG